MNEILTMFAIYIALFLFGMTVMKQGLFHIQERRTKDFLYKAVDHPLKSFLVGIVVTALLQSSSAVMIMTVGLVATGYLSFKHSIGIILGANIGTVVTLEILAIDLSWLILPALLIGIPLLLTRRTILFSIGCLSFGFGSILVAMHGFETLAYPISSLSTVYDWIISTNEFEFLAISIGVVLSGMIQSSSAVTAIAMTFMNENLFSLPTGIGIMLGANVGTCLTAWLASLGGSKESKLTAYAHIWLNVLGLIIFFPFIQTFANFVEMTSSSPSQQLAHATLFYNVISSAIILPFINHFTNFILWIHRGSQHIK
ncbi:Na/Pi symporter [Bacillus shivajii]|uniref:Na/Pi symporter n=1 Tax=Bacillus shivajii TaxID=1983719 RepID=UPI001CFAF281|nr:Na/Pi symporter [Bacillus shivajii]UCZ54491.1 Na/Pi symporter [Bacillus shivajii]